MDSMIILRLVEWMGLNEKMEYQQLKTKFGTVIIKDAEEPELNELVNICKSVFTRHNIFQKEFEKVLEYKKEIHKRHSDVGGGFIVAKIEDKVIGGVLLKRVSEDLKGKHIVWRLNHLAVSEEYSGEGIGSGLVNAAEQKIKDLINEEKMNTAKIELGVSENEKDAVEFYNKLGFEVEGELKSHYRHGELVYVLGKEILK